MNKARIKTLLAEYGKVAIFTWFGLFILSLVGFSSAIAFGFDVKSTGAGVGVLGGAYVATQVIKPLRIGATLVLTPVIARLLRRWFPKSGPRRPDNAASPELSAPPRSGS